MMEPVNLELGLTGEVAVNPTIRNYQFLIMRHPHPGCK